MISLDEKRLEPQGMISLYIFFCI